MKTEYALRHLLLRHLERLEGVVPRERYLEVTRTLRVEVRGRSAYVVAYRDRGREHEQSLPFEAFRFYERGDTRIDRRSLDDDLGNRNDELARSFAEQVFGVAGDSLPERAAEPLEAHRRAAMLEMGVFAVATAWAAELDAMASLALLSLVLAEFARHGRLLSSGLFWIVAITGPPSATLLAASVYAMLQLLDPNPEHRIPRVGLCLLAVVLAGARLASQSEFAVWGLPAAGGLVVATGIAVLRSLHSSHFRALCLALPFYCAGLVLDQRIWGAGTGLLVLALGTALTAAGHRWSPVQRGRI